VIRFLNESRSGFAFYIQLNDFYKNIVYMQFKLKASIKLNQVRVDHLKKIFYQEIDLYRDELVKKRDKKSKSLLKKLG
jgi:hypothetical protein